MASWRGAFECRKCPASNDHQAGRACPAWTELVMTNVATGEEKLNKACLFQLLPTMLVEVIKASNRPSAEIGAMRNEVFVGLGRVAEAFGRQQGPLFLKQDHAALPNPVDR